MDGAVGRTHGKSVMAFAIQSARSRITGYERAAITDIGHKALCPMSRHTKSGHTMTNAQGIIGGSVKSHVS